MIFATTHILRLRLHHQSSSAIRKQLSNFNRKDPVLFTARSASLHLDSRTSSTSSDFISKTSYSKQFTFHYNSPIKIFNPPSPPAQAELQTTTFTAYEKETAILESGFNSWVAAVLICSVAFTVLFGIPIESGNTQLKRDTYLPAEHEDRSAIFAEDYSKMTGESLAGRPGTLTPEEEERLKEFWVAVLRVFGVLDPKEAGNGSAEVVKSDAASVNKPKKKRIGLFRKKDSEETESAASELGSHADTEDKYGQTKEFHEALANQSPESLRAAFWSMVKHDHPDALLLRFLRARKWHVENALVMMVSTMRWRSNEMHVDDDIMRNGELGALEDSQGSDPAKKKMGADFLQQMRMGKSYLHGLDIEDRPITVVRARLHKQGEQSEESLERYTVFLIESARMILSPPVDTGCIIFDMTGFSLANMDYAPVKFMIKCFEANYPESLGVILVHKAPWIFQGIWKIIRGWLDPVVASKITFTNNDTELKAYIPTSRIIRELDGPEDWSYSYIEAVAGENDRMKDTATRDELIKKREGIVDEYEKTILQWIHSEGDGDALKKRKHEIAAELREDYWKLDPYIRARSYYDRIGLIGEGGKLTFYPAKTETPIAPVSTPANGTVTTSADDID